MGIKEKLESWLKKALGMGGFVLVHPTDSKNGDYSIIISDGNAEEILSKLESSKLQEIEKLELVLPRFINIYLSKNFFAESVSEINKNKENFGKNNVLEGEKIFFEHTQPNPFKEFHIGHLMNNAIGESIARVLKFSGGELKLATYHGDVGLHVAKAVWGLLNRKKTTGVDILKEMQERFGVLGDSYVSGDIQFNSDTANKEDIIEINRKIYDRSDEEINAIYDVGRIISLDYFESIYKRLDNSFDFHFYESESGEKGKNLVEENIPKVFEESEGAVVFKGENFEPKTHTRVFLNKDRLPTYEAKELGLAQMKKEKWSYDRSVTITANEQDSFFKVVEVAIGEVFGELKGKLKHISHGLLKLPSGKMSSRTGDIITAEVLISQVKDKILEKISGREFDDSEKEEIAEIIAIGAIKYTILRQSVGGDIVFDFDKSISFEGDSGPYLQYTCVRAKSALEKAVEENVAMSNDRPENFEITELERILYRFPEIVERAGREYSPHYLVTYLTELAGEFNSFYAQEKIVDSADPNSPYKISITEAVSIVLQNGLYLLGIKVPKRM